MKEHRAERVQAAIESGQAAHSERQLEGGEWEMLFTPPAAAATAPPPQRAQTFYEWPEPKIQLHNRDLDSPEPMVRILGAAEKLAGETLSALVRREPSSCFRCWRSGT